MAVNLDVDVVEVEEEILEQRQRHLAECPYTSANLSLTLSSIITIIIIPALCSRKSCTFTGICVHSLHSNYKTTQTAPTSIHVPQLEKWVVTGLQKEKEQTVSAFTFFKRVI